MTTEYKQQIINYLLSHQEFIPGAKLSATLNVSIKTIARTIKKINSQYLDRPIIESKRGRGYRLNYQNYINKGKNKDQFIKIGQITSIERRNEIIKELLITSPQKRQLHDIWKKFYVSESSRALDIKMIRKMIAKYNLLLKRQNDHIWIEGSENRIRAAISDLLVADDVGSINYFLQDNQYVQKRDAYFVVKQLNIIEGQIHSEIPYPYNVNLFSHLYILIERYHRVGSLADSKFKLNKSEAAKLLRNEKILTVCQKVIGNISIYLNANLSKIEIYHLYQYLTSSRVNNKETRDKVAEKPRLITNYLIDNVSEELSINKNNNQILFDKLIKHMKPLLNRLENNIKVKNILLEQIILEYPNLFKVVKHTTKELSRKFNLNLIDDAEIGFITIYFAESIESNRPPINVLIVCTTGFGTAQLLKTKIEKRFSDLNIVELVASGELKSRLNNYPEIDLIVSTISLSDDIKIPVLVVSAMLTIEDQNLLEKKVSFIREEEKNIGENSFMGTDIF